MDDDATVSGQLEEVACNGLAHHLKGIITLAWKPG